MSPQNFVICMLPMLAFGLGGISLAHSDEILVDQNAKLKQAFVLIQAEMTDPESFFTRYALPAEQVVGIYGGRALLATFDKKVLEGAWDNNWTIALRFPSLKAATDWYYSYEYQALIPYRHAATAFGNMVVFEGLPESVINWHVSQYDGAIPTLRFPETLDTTPEFIVTVSPHWVTNEGKFRVSASFKEINLKGSILSIEIKIPRAYVDNQLFNISMLLKDTSGRHANLGSTLANKIVADEWHRLEFSIDLLDYRTGPYGREQMINMTKINAVEIEFSANRKPANISGDIQIRNLMVYK